MPSKKPKKPSTHSVGAVVHAFPSALDRVGLDWRGAAAAGATQAPVERSGQERRQEALKAEDGLPSTGFLREDQVLQLLPFSRSTWWAGVKAKRHPAPVKISPRVTVWTVESIRSLMERLRDSTVNCEGAANE